MVRERLSRGRANHRRRELAESRRELRSDCLTRRISDLEQAERRTEEINHLLDLELTPQQRAALTVERIWLEFRLGVSTQRERQSSLQGFLNGLEEKKPDIFAWLTEEDGDGMTRLAEIRDGVIPPTTIKGHYTKSHHRF